MRFVNGNIDLGDKPDWNYLSSNCILTEDFMDANVGMLPWDILSSKQVMSIEFMLKHRDRINWKMASANQYLPEEFAEHFPELVSMPHFVVGQPLSEGFLAKNKDKFGWHDVSRYQCMSEEFISEMSEYVDWSSLSQAPLTETFIDANIDRLEPGFISVYQKLSKDFIKDHSKWLIPRLIADYQCDLPDGYMPSSPSSWYGKDIEYKRSYMKFVRSFDMDGDYVIAYKACRLDGYSTYNFHYQYAVGSIYESTADHNADKLNSFGLSACTYDCALDYYPHRIVKVKIHLDDIAVVVPVSELSPNYMIRCRKYKVLK